MGVLRAVLPARYSAVQASGIGLLSVYLAEIPQDFAEVLAGLIGAEAQSFTIAVEVPIGAADERVVTGDDLDVW